MTPAHAPTGSPRSAPVAITVLAAVLVGAWLLVDPRTPDLAAQVYRVDLYRQLGFVVWDEHWYAGHHMPGYSLLFPPLGALLGVRLLGALCVLASSMLFERLASSIYGNAARWGAALFAVAALGDVWSGRVTFALGVTFAVAAALAWRRGHLVWAGALGALCACASPMAGAFLGLAGLTVALADRSPRALLALTLPATAVVLGLEALFPEGGYEPFPATSFAVTALVTVGFVVGLPRDARTLRIGGILYLLVCVACVLVHTPVGSNVERYGVLLAGPLLLCARLTSRAERHGATGAGVGLAATTGAAGTRDGLAARAGVAGAGIGPAVAMVVAALALCVTAVWVVWGPVRETLAVAGSEATSASYYAPVKRFLAGVAAQRPVRVEVPLTRSHWEAALLAPTTCRSRAAGRSSSTRATTACCSRPGLTAAAY